MFLLALFALNYYCLFLVSKLCPNYKTQLLFCQANNIIAEWFTCTAIDHDQMQSKTLGQNLIYLLRRPLSQIGSITSFVLSGVEGALDEEDDDDVPDLVENFDEASKGEDVVKSEGNLNLPSH